MWSCGRRPVRASRTRRSQISCPPELFTQRMRARRGSMEHGLGSPTASIMAGRDRIHGVVVLHVAPPPGCCSWVAIPPPGLLQRLGSPGGAALPTDCTPIARPQLPADSEIHRAAVFVFVSATAAPPRRLPGHGHGPTVPAGWRPLLRAVDWGRGGAFHGPELRRHDAGEQPAAPPWSAIRYLAHA